MRLSLQLIVVIIVLLLFLASIIALYFAMANQYTIPLLLIAVINTEAVVFLVFLITRGIIAPIRFIRQVLKKVGEGDFEVRLKLEAAREITELVISLNEMVSKLQDAKIHEEEVERLKSEFLSLAAHQLRTPLGTIKWTLQTLLDGDLGALAPQQKEYLLKTLSSDERMIALVNDLLDVTKIEEGRYLYEPSPVQIKDLVQELVQEYQQEADRREVKLALEPFEKEFPEIVGDGEKIRLAIQNLIDNALRYTSKGGRVTVALKHGTENIEISVQDTGIGIPQDQQQHVFEKFFRADNAKKMETQGTGLGLYLAKNIVEAHEGTLSFHSKENKGTQFLITLPLKQK